MAVRIACPKCSATYQVPEDLAGKTVRCRKCQHAFVPSNPPKNETAPPPTTPKSADQWQPVMPTSAPKSSSVKPAAPAKEKPKSKLGLILLLAGGALAALLFVGLIGVVVVVWLVARPRAQAETEASAPPVQVANEAGANRKRPESPVSKFNNPPIDSPAKPAEPAAKPPAPAPPGPVAGNGTLSREKVEAMKRLTVFINTTTPREKAQGSGFLFSVQGDRSYIATNDHVVFGEELPVAGTRLSTELKKVTVTVTFHSGTAEERTFPAEVVASDPLNDLAILRITGANTLAKPLDISVKGELYETQPLFVFGFPLGSNLGGGRNPAITVGKGSVSSMRRNKQNNLMLVQLQGDINPGNSGGPVVDDTGRFLGVVVAKILGSQIGFAIPADRLRAMLNGMTGIPGFTVIGGDSEQVQIKVGVDLIDPFDKIKSVRFHYAAGDFENKDVPDGPFAALANSREVVLQKQDRTYTGTFTVKRRDLINAMLTGQAQYSFGDGPAIWGRPFNFQVPFRGMIAGAGRQRPPIIMPPRGRIGGNRPAPFAPPVDALSLEAKTVELPCAATDVVVGGDGRYLILKLTLDRKIALFDLKEGKITKTIAAPDEEFMLGASHDKLFLVLSATNVIQRYNLATLEREKTSPIPFKEKPVRMAVGYCSTGPLAFATTIREYSQEKVPGIRFVDGNTLKEKSISIPEESRHWVWGIPRYPVDLRMSANGKVLALWTPRISPSGITVMTLNNYAAKVQSEPDSVGTVVPDAVGKFFYTQTGVFTSNLKRISEKQEFSVDEVPAINGPFCASLYWGDERTPLSSHNFTPLVRIKTAGSEHVMFTLKDIDGLQGEEFRFGRIGAPYDKRLFLNQEYQALVTIPLSADRLIVHRFDIEKALEKSAGDYLLVTSLPETSAARGKPYRYQIVAKSSKGGIIYKLESAPKGMTVSAEGKISWAVPSDFKDMDVEVVVNLKNSGGTEAIHNYRIQVAR